jgi:DNA-directed RNA polymerase subunit A'
MEEKLIKRVQFCFFKNKEIVETSDQNEVRDHKLFNNDGTPHIHGPISPFFGVQPEARADEECRVCGKNPRHCQGHYMYLKLKKPITLQPALNLLVTFLNCFCYICKRLKMDEAIQEELLAEFRLFDPGYNRMTKIHSNISDTCRTCGNALPFYKVKKYNVEFVDKVASTKPYFLSASEIEHQLMAIDQRLNTSISRELFGNINPMGVIINSILFPPNNCRPQSKNSTKYTHSITRHIQRLVKASQRDRLEIDTGAIQEEYIGLINSKYKHIPKACQLAGDGIKQTLSGKGKIIRQDWNGARNNKTARAVIGCDPDLNIDEVGIPEYMCAKLTVPVIVTRDNIQWLENILRRSIKDSEIDQVIERPLIDGDIVVMNRQPSLSRYSIMAHKAKIMPHPSRTINLNINVTTAYNADFDGDEMNVFMPMSIKSSVEVSELLSPTLLIVDEVTNKVCIKAVQNQLSGVYLLTDAATMLERSIISRILPVSSRNWWASLPPDRQLISGRELLSSMLPFSCGGDGDMVIVKNNINKSLLDKIIYAIYKFISPQAAGNFINELRLLIKKWLPLQGMSFSLKDLQFHPHFDANTTLHHRPRLDAIANVEEDIVLNMGPSDIFYCKLNHRCQCRGAIKKYIHIGVRVLVRKFPSKPEFNLIIEVMEDNTNMEIDAVASSSSPPPPPPVTVLLTKGEDILEHLSNTNNLKLMIHSGSKGKPVNVEQLMVRLGPQMVGNQLVENGDIDECFVTGLRDSAYFLHAMTGRDGVISTSTQTAETGYIQRRLTKFCEPLILLHDGTVRDVTTNKIVVSNLTRCLSKRNARHLAQFYKQIQVYQMKDCVKDTILRQKILDISPTITNIEADDLDQVARKALEQQYIEICKHRNMAPVTDYESVLNTFFLDHCRLVDIGTNIGVRVAQNIDCLTQSRLSRFHLAGVQRIDPIPRLLAMLQLSTNEKNLYMEIPMLDHQQLSTLMDLVRHITFSDLFSSWTQTEDHIIASIKPEYVNSSILLNKLEQLQNDRIIVLRVVNHTEVYFSKAASDTIQKLLSHTLNGSDKISGFNVTDNTVYFNGYDEELLMKVCPSRNWLLQMTTNNIIRIYEMYGLVVATKMIKKELITIWCSCGEELDELYAEVLAKQMTISGYPQKVNRNTLKQLQRPTLMRASNEEAMSAFIESAFHGVEEAVIGATECQFFGRLPRMGTGMLDLRTV